MWKSFLILSARRLKRDSLFSLINFLGLSIGLAVFIIIYGYINFERSFDSYQNSDKIFRVQNNYVRHGELIYNSAATFAGVGPFMKEYFSEVSDYARFFPWGKIINVNVRHSEDHTNNFRVKDLIYADNAIIELLDFELIDSGTKDLLIQPNTVIISQSFAEKVFGNNLAIGNTLIIESEHGSNDLVTVTGVFANRSRNTHAHFDVVVSYPTLYTWGEWRGEPAQDSFSANMGTYFFHTYIKIDEVSQISTISDRMQDFLDKYKPRYKELDKNGNRARVNEFSFVNVADIHLNSRLQNEYEVNGDDASLQILGFVAIIILILAWMNFVNLYTARSIERAKEVGIRKSIGSSKMGLMALFLSEAFILNLVSLGLAFTTVQIARPLIEDFSGSEILLFQNNSLQFALFAVILLIIGTLVSGLYPAFMISRYDPLKTLKGSLSKQTEGRFLRKGLVLGQFVISIGLSICTLGIYNQLSYMMQSDYGFEKENILIVEKPALSMNMNNNGSIQFKEALKKYNNILSVGASDGIPGKGILRGMAVSRVKSNGDDRPFHSIEEVTADYDFITTYALNIEAGRNFSHSFASDTAAMILNEKAVEVLGFENPDDAIDETVYLYTQIPYKIIGVVSNYHHESLHMKIDPMFFQMRPETDFLISVRFSGNPGEAVNIIKKEYSTFFKDQPIQYYFLDDFFSRQYEADKQFLIIFQWFTFLALFIAAIGLLGLIVYSANTKIKEFGIRKVLGAVGYQLIHILGKEFIVLLSIGSLIAIPISYLWLSEWLESFAYQVNLGVWNFMVPVIFVLVICVVVILTQVSRVLRINPADVLRYE